MYPTALRFENPGRGRRTQFSVRIGLALLALSVFAACGHSGISGNGQPGGSPVSAGNAQAIPTRPPGSLINTLTLPKNYELSVIPSKVILTDNGTESTTDLGLRLGIFNADGVPVDWWPDKVAVKMIAQLYSNSSEIFVQGQVGGGLQTNQVVDALDPLTGNVLWSVPTSDHGTGKPDFIADSNDNIVVVCSDTPDPEPIRCTGYDMRGHPKYTFDCHNSCTSAQTNAGQSLGRGSLSMTSVSLADFDSASKTYTLYDANTGKVLFRESQEAYEQAYASEHKVPTATQSAVSDSSSLPDGGYIAVTTRNQIIRVDAAGKTLWSMPADHDTKIRVFSNDRILVVGPTGDFVVLDFASGKTVEIIAAAKMAPDLKGCTSGEFLTNREVVLSCTDHVAVIAL